MKPSKVTIGDVSEVAGLPVNCAVRMDPSSACSTCHCSIEQREWQGLVMAYASGGFHFRDSHGVESLGARFTLNFLFFSALAVDRGRLATLDQQQHSRRPLRPTQSLEPGTQAICMLSPALLLRMTFFTISSTRSQSSVGTFCGDTPKYADILDSCSHDSLL